MPRSGCILEADMFIISTYIPELSIQVQLKITVF